MGTRSGSRGRAEDAGEDAEEEEEEQRSDFLHVNAVDWHPTRDQILITVPELGEISGVGARKLTIEVIQQGRRWRVRARL